MNEFAEQCVLGSALLFPESVPEIVDSLTGEMFSVPLHREIFSALCDTYWKGETVDIAAMIRRFHDQREYLVNMADQASLYTHYGDYMRAIQEDWQLGKMVGDFEQAAHSDGGVAEILEWVESICAQHRELLESRMATKGGSFTEAFSRYVKWSREEKGTVIKTGFSILDEATGGFMPGTVFTLAARPGGGKSDFALNMAMKAAKAGAKVLYVTLEMTELQLMQRVASKLMHINSIRIRDRKLTPEEDLSLDGVMKIIHNMRGLDFLEDTGMSVGKLWNYVRLHKPQVVFVDYIGLMKRPNVKEQYRALGIISNQLKRMALKEKIAVVQLAQMNRQVENRKGGKPNLSDLRESGDLEQDSDFVGFLCPQIVEGRVLRGQDSADVFLYLEKNRHAGVGKFTFQWMPQYHDYVEVENRYG